MAVPSYTTDLLTIELAEAATAWAEPTAVGWTYGAGAGQNDDNPFQGLYSVSKAFNATGVGGLLANKGSAMTIPTDGAFTGWFSWGAPGSLDLDANGGIRFMCGTDLANFLSWDVGGLPSYAYGGWVNFAVNTTITADDTVGTGLGNSQYSGAAVSNLNSIFKGDPFFVDGFRYGRCEARINGGEAANYATFAGYAAVNDLNTVDNYNRWGLFQAIAGGYLRVVNSTTGAEVLVKYESWTGSVFTLVGTLGTQCEDTWKVYVPIIDEAAAATSIENSIVKNLASTVYIRTVVRLYVGAGTSIIPWSQDTTLPNTGVTVNATRTNDGIVL